MCFDEDPNDPNKQNIESNNQNQMKVLADKVTDEGAQKKENVRNETNVDLVGEKLKKT